MIDTEVLDLIADAARDRIDHAYRTMRANGADDRTIRRVVTDMLTSSAVAAQIDGTALGVRQLRELGIDVAPDVGAALTPGQRVAADTAYRNKFTKALDTVLDGSPDEVILMRLTRIAHAESVEAAQASAAEIAKGSELVDGWVRQRDSDPCELCTWWWRGGRVWPVSHTMPTHKGCTCAQLFTSTASASMRMVSTEARIASDRRAAAGDLDQRRTMGEGTWSQVSTRGRPPKG